MFPATMILLTGMIASYAAAWDALPFFPITWSWTGRAHTTHGPLWFQATTTTLALWVLHLDSPNKKKGTWKYQVVIIIMSIALLVLGWINGESVMERRVHGCATLVCGVCCCIYIYNCCEFKSWGSTYISILLLAWMGETGVKILHSYGANPDWLSPSWAAVFQWTQLGLTTWTLDQLPLH
jgi:hypothetical protein